MRLNQRLLTISAGLCLSLALAGTVLAVRPQEAYAAVSTASRNQSTGWLHKGNQWQYALSDGTLIRGGWIRDGNGWYYFDADGIMVSDTTRDIEGHTYSFERSGAWKETPTTDPLFVHLPSGRFENSVYEHPWAGIRITLPEYTFVQTAEELNVLSAHDYIPSYYDFLAVTPDQSLFGVVIQYNSDPIEQILGDDLNVFSAFWGKYDLTPTAPRPVTVAGQTYQKMVCKIPENLEMNVYLRNEDNKVVYLFSIAADEETADRLIETVVPCG